MSAFIMAFLLAISAQGAQPGTRQIDIVHSRVLIRVYKAGLFSAFGHNHQIEAPIASGRVDLADPPAASLLFQAARLTVLDPEVSSRTRAEIQRTMLGAEVLDTGRFSEIDFESKRIDRIGPSRWRVRGALTLHGVSRPVTFDVTEEQGIYRGNVSIRQTDFGIRPIRIAGGTVKVKDQIRIEVEIRLVSISGRPAPGR